jgi:hypothetical protein
MARLRQKTKHLVQVTDMTPLYVMIPLYNQDPGLTSSPLDQEH